MRTLIAAFLIVICSPVLCMSQDSNPYGYDAPRGGWITRLGRHGSAEINVKGGDIVKVDLVGSAEKSEFYYSIVETTGKAELLSVPTQVIWNPSRWGSITTTGLFRAKEDTGLRFSANFIKGDTPGRVRVAGLTLIATVVGSGPINLARIGGAKASESSTRHTGADRAIDGNTDGNFRNSSVTHTQDEPNSWWRVELPSRAKIEKIVIWNRTDCCSIRLSNFRISVLDDSEKKVWSEFVKDPVERSKLFEIDPPKEGRFVKVQIQGKNLEGNGILSLAEVEVFGEFTK